MRVIVESTVTCGGQTDRIRTEAEGRFYEKNGVWYLLYKEPEKSGLSGTATTIKAQSGSVTILRTGPYASRLIIEPGKTYNTAYPTEAGVFDLTVKGERAAVLLRENGGEIRLQYTLCMAAGDADVPGEALAQKITMKIQVGDFL